MTDWNPILERVQTQYDDNKDPDYVPAVPGFPFEKMYKGQKEAVEKLQQCKDAILSPHTGAGKTAVFLTLAQGHATLVIEPRKFLQKQVAAYRDDTILFGRKEYPCSMADDASTAPCIRKFKCDKTDYHKTCDRKRPGCLKEPCKLFLHENEFYRYPCNQCAYNSAMRIAAGVIGHGGTIICNFGNFWKFVRDADLIIIDEADLFFKEISSPEWMRHSKDPDTPIQRMIADEVKDIERSMQTCTTKQYYAMKNKLYRLDFLLSVAGLCFSYKKRDKKTGIEKIFVEVNPDSVNLLKETIFGDKRVIIVSATAGVFKDTPNISYSIHQRAKIYYTPVGKLTSRELETQPWILNRAAKFIDEASALFGGLYGSKKFIVHCGNIGNHATKMNAMLNDLEGCDACTLHESGNLMATLDKFKAGDKKYLLVASGEYGLDASEIECQFVLKVPFASLDDRMRALEKKIGKSQFSRLYALDAITRMVQMCGRIGRGYNSFGCTFILDAKFAEIYSKYKSDFPVWFKERLILDVFTS